jgi:4-carboxymuconolactone decarboxylase
MKTKVTDSAKARADGIRVLKQLGWPLDSGFKDMDKDFWEFTTEHLFGQLWARPGLSLRDRALVTLSVLLAVDADRGSMNHIRFARNVGITEEQMREIIIQVGYYAGWPKGAHAMARFFHILNDPKSGWRPAPKKKTKKQPKE